MTQAEYYSGVKKVPYDLLREVTLVGAGILVIIVAFAGVFSSPDDKPLTMQGVAASNPVGFVTVSLSELAGNSDIAQYGQPYNTQTGSVQYLGPISLQQIGGVSIPIDTAHVYVLDPLAMVKSADVQAAVQQFGAASATQQTTWETNYATALGNANGTLDSQGNLHLAAGDYGPLPTMFDSLLNIARSGALDGLLLTEGKFYQTDYTRPLLFLNEDALPSQAGALNLQGSQWGMMNETGAYPGQAWLWLYTFWYQVPVGPFNGPNADVAVLLVMAVLTLALILVPIIPGLNRLPELIPIHKLIWRQHYREAQAEVKAKQTTTAPPATS